MPALTTTAQEREPILLLMKCATNQKWERHLLAAHTDYSERRIRRILSDLAKLGEPIVYDTRSAGYEYTNDPAKILRCIRDLKSRRGEISSRIDGLERAYKESRERKPQQVLF